MNRDRDSIESSFQPLRIPHIANEIPQTGMVKTGGLHVMLLELIAAEDDQLARMEIPQHYFHKLFAKGPGSSRHDYDLFRPVHSTPLITLKAVRSATVIV